MRNIAIPPRRRRRLAVGIVLGTVVLVSLTGAYALRTVFARPGEGALRYVPADSVVVASIDLVPSASQTLAFKRIDDSLDRNSLGNILEKSILQLIDHSKTADDLSPIVLRSGAICVTPKDGSAGADSGLAFLAVKDGVEASKILQKDAYPQFYKGIKYYKTGKSSMLIMVVDDLLVITDKPEQFAKVKAIQSGETKSITTVPDFVAAKENIADDANIMVYVSPKIMESMIGKTDSKVALPEWMAMGLAIRDGGVGLSCSAKTDLSKNPTMRNLSEIAPVRRDLFQVMPSGSYGMFAMSNISGYYDVIESNMPDQKAVKKQFAEMEDSVQKGIGLSVQHDLIPALKGDAVAAVYPSTDGTASGLDLLMIVDDTNGANPADAVARFQTFVEQQTAKEGNSPKLFEEKAITGGREFRINDKMQSDMRKSIGDGVGKDTVNQDLMVGDKTIVFAMVGQTVIASTSQKLLDKAVASYESKTNGLTGDSKFEPSEKTLLDGSQEFAAFSLSRIAEGVKNTVNTSKMNDENRKMFNSIVGAFQSLNDPLYIKGKTGADGIGSGGVFIPLDYDKLIDLIGGQMNKKS